MNRWLTLLAVVLSTQCHIGHLSIFHGDLENHVSCSRSGTGFKKIYVCDPEKVLGPDDVEAGQLDELIIKIINETKCPCSEYSCSTSYGGYKIGIAIMSKMSNDDSTLDEDDDDQFEQKTIRNSENLNKAQKLAQEVKQAWKLGKCDEDVIIFYSHEDKVLWTATGEVASQKLTKTLVTDISKNAYMSGFDRSAFDGLFSIVNDYRAVFLGKYKSRNPKIGQSHSSGTFSVISSANYLPLLSHIVILLLSFFAF